MKFYLSSYMFGNHPQLLVELFGENKRVGYIINALDAWELDQDRLHDEMQGLQELGLSPEILDLKEYFGKYEALEEKLATLGGVWINGGSVFVLRAAMKLSGFDEWMFSSQEKEFVYAGYSAGCCVLSPSFEGLQQVDDPRLLTYELTEPIMEGLGLLDFLYLPHYESNHPESDDIEKEVEYCINNKILFKTFRDGEVLILE